MDDKDKAEFEARRRRQAGFLRHLAITMLGLLFLIVVVAFTFVFTDNFRSSCTTWLTGSLVIACLYFVIFILIVLSDPEVFFDKDKTSYNWAVLSCVAFALVGFIVLLVVGGIWWVSGTATNHVLSSLVICALIIAFDFTITSPRIPVHAADSWVKFFRDAIPLDVVVFLSLAVIFVYCCVVGAKDTDNVEHFATGASAFSMAISTGLFSMYVLREQEAVAPK